MKNGVLIALSCSLIFLLLFSGISAAQVYGQGYYDQGYYGQGHPASGYNSGWPAGMQGSSGYSQGNVYGTTQYNEACQSGDCNVVSDQSYNSKGVPRQIEVLIPVTELVNDIQRIKQTIITPVCEQTTVIQRPYSTLTSGTEETIQSKDCIDDGNGNCVPAIPGSPSKPVEVNGTTIWGQATTQTSNQCHYEVNVTILPQVIQKEATAYKIVRFTWVDYVNTEVIKTTYTGTPQVSEITLPSGCMECGPQKYGAIGPYYPAPYQTGSLQKEYQYGSPYENVLKPRERAWAEGGVFGNEYEDGY